MNDQIAAFRVKHDDSSNNEEEPKIKNENRLCGNIQYPWKYRAPM